MAWATNVVAEGKTKSLRKVRTLNLLLLTLEKVKSLVILRETTKIIGMKAESPEMIDMMMAEAPHSESIAATNLTTMKAGVHRDVIITVTSLIQPEMVTVIGEVASEAVMTTEEDLLVVHPIAVEVTGEATEAVMIVVIAVIVTTKEIGKTEEATKAEMMIVSDLPTEANTRIDASPTCVETATNGLTDHTKDAISVTDTTTETIEEIGATAAAMTKEVLVLGRETTETGAMIETIETREIRGICKEIRVTKFGQASRTRGRRSSRRESFPGTRVIYVQNCKA